MRLENFTHIIDLEKVDSTNSYLKKNSDDLNTGTVLFAKDQTGGKGRLGRSWYGEPGKSIFCSFLIKNIYESSDAIRLSFLFSLAVKMMLTKYIDSGRIVLKWPNDVTVSGKKICGILSEYSKECVIIGIGINIMDFIPKGNISYPYTSVESEAVDPPDIEIMKNELIESVNMVYRRYCTNTASDIPLIWFREADIKGRPVTVNIEGKAISGVIDSIDDLGCLIINNGHGLKERIFYGDVTYNDQF
ncbi:MAG: biotin--[acetyl-CoA-carboxylase] ligase [Candidatus Delongbacteria bacterium]|nr:biotin--[acetyl-CoA-carboxylase] ligase [Candidatus Delongbacteria bacterium]